MAAEGERIDGAKLLAARSLQVQTTVMRVLHTNSWSTSTGTRVHEAPRAPWEATAPWKANQYGLDPGHRHA